MSASPASINNPWQERVKALSPVAEPVSVNQRFPAFYVCDPKAANDM
jgi:hypothetical protein